MARAASQRLEQDYYSQNFKPDLTEQVIDTLTLVKNRVITRLYAHNTQVSRNSQDVSSYIAHKRLKNSDIEGNLRDHRLKEALRIKRTLEGKLSQVAYSIEKLGEIEEKSQSPTRVDLRDSKVRKQFFSEESARRQEAAELVEKLRKEQIEISHRQREREKEMKNRIQSAELAAEKAKEEEMNRKKEEKERKIEEIKEGIRKRQEAMNEKRQLEAAELERMKAKKYANEKLLQDFHRRILMPQEEERAEVISKIKQLHKPISKDEIEEHARRVDEEIKQLTILRETDRRGRLPEPFATRTSTFTQSILLQARKEGEEKEALESEKRALQAKRKHYSELVKSLFVPAVDVFKQKEMELMKERLKAHSVTSRPQKELQSPFRPHKFKPNPMVPVQKERKPTEVQDYLAERRKMRDVLDLEEKADEELVGVIKAKLGAIEPGQ